MGGTVSLPGIKTRMQLQKAIESVLPVVLGPPSLGGAPLK